MVKDGGELLEHAITLGYEDLVDLFIKHGADISLPPEFIKSKPEYRSTPFSITAAIAGDYKILKKILSLGDSLSDSGAIGLSKRRKNVVISNHLGAAAWHGKVDMVENLLKLSKQGLDQLSVEEPDTRTRN